MSESEFHTHGFGPVYDENSRVLILGSFPSVRSREVSFYYGHPRNRFWPLIARLTGEAVPETIKEKKELLLVHRIALWDSIESCRITGSSDTSIKDVTPVDIKVITDAADIKIIACNGAASKRYYDKYLKKVTGLEAVKLPSTSPANAAWSIDRLFSEWEGALGGYINLSIG
ncbi:MAG: DNA-deoxyinosine glycosylase [Anaerovoracaceae bacterium]|nr:DNA-deoxyinosine glycosylase [Bacillota bacterium]MDY2671268.1 DNA-deoxyinosine glycosylase [Anaerovoracaceae bacterium]